MVKKQATLTTRSRHA
ncbi:hypothetical protein ECEC96038_2316, partial [Escherichia coli EC96038]